MVNYIFRVAISFLFLLIGTKIFSYLEGKNTEEGASIKTDVKLVIMAIYVNIFGWLIIINLIKLIKASWLYWVIK